MRTVTLQSETYTATDNNETISISSFASEGATKLHALLNVTRLSAIAGVYPQFRVFAVEPVSDASGLPIHVYGGTDANSYLLSPDPGVYQIVDIPLHFPDYRMSVFLTRTGDSVTFSGTLFLE